MIELRAIPGPTGRLLRGMLAERGLLTGRAQGVVNYGYSGRHTDLPILNERAGTFNKLKELQLLVQNGVNTVPFAANANDVTVPLMGRSLHHTRGSDIIVYRVHQPSRMYNVRHDYFTQLVPKAREYRVWAFRGTPIGTYEKVLSYPRKNGRHGRHVEVWNWRNGYAYEFRHPDNVEALLKDVGTAAVEALGLDFGASDIILGTDRDYYVLEVNTAPGVEGPRQGLTSLVNHIERWARGGFRRRRSDADSD